MALRTRIPESDQFAVGSEVWASPNSSLSADSPLEPLAGIASKSAARPTVMSVVVFTRSG
jgi:hypothetical protein